MNSETWVHFESGCKFYIIYLLLLIGIDKGLLVVGLRLLVAQVFRFFL